jgi:hypothetical protein
MRAITDWDGPGGGGQGEAHGFGGGSWEDDEALEESDWRQSKVSALVRNLAYGKQGRYRPDEFEDRMVSPRMESSFEDIGMEERRSTKLAAKSDREAAQQERLAQERKRQRLGR